MRGARRTAVRRRPGTGTALLLACGLAAGCGDVRVPDAEPTVLAAAHASNPTVAVDAATGDALVAWVSSVEGESNVMLARWSGGEPGRAVRVNDVDGDAAPHLQAPARVAAGPGGHVYVAWTNATRVEGRRFPTSELRFARSRDGGRTFERAIYVNDDAGGEPTSHTFHDMVVAPDGTIVVSWIDGRTTRPAPPPSGDGGHGSHGDADGGSSPADAPAPYDGPEIRVAFSIDGGASFGPSAVVDDDACPCCRTDLAVGPEGTLYIAWRKVFEGSVRDVVVARSLDGGRTWEEPVRVHDDGWVFGGCPHAGPTLATDAEGAVHVAWYTGREGGPGLFYVRSDDGGVSFRGATPLLTGAWVPPSQVELGVTASGSLWALWEDRTLEEPVTYLGVAAPGRVPDVARARALAGTNPSLGAGEAGAFVAWLSGGQVLALRGSG